MEPVCYQRIRVKVMRAGCARSRGTHASDVSDDVRRDDVGLCDVSDDVGLRHIVNPHTP